MRNWTSWALACSCLMTMGCASSRTPQPHRTITVDYQFLDLTTCDRCVGTEGALDEALRRVRPTLDELGVQIAVRKTLVASEAQAAALGFVSSPTLRIDGRDIAGELKENACGPCGDICGDGVDCRVWTYRGQDYTVPPVDMIADAILQAARDDTRSPVPVARRDVPTNLKRFFAGSAPASAACCDPGCCTDGKPRDCCDGCCPDGSTAQR